MVCIHIDQRRVYIDCKAKWVEREWQMVITTAAVLSSVGDPWYRQDRASVIEQADRSRVAARNADKD